MTYYNCPGCKRKCPFVSSPEIRHLCLFPEAIEHPSAQSVQTELHRINQLAPQFMVTEAAIRKNKKQFVNYTHEEAVIGDNESFDEWEQRMKAIENKQGWNIGKGIFKPGSIKSPRLKKWGSWKDIICQVRLNISYQRTLIESLITKQKEGKITWKDFSDEYDRRNDYVLWAYEHAFFRPGESEVTWWRRVKSHPSAAVMLMKPTPDKPRKATKRKKCKVAIPDQIRKMYACSLASDRAYRSLPEIPNGHYDLARFKGVDNEFFLSTAFQLIKYHLGRIINPENGFIVEGNLNTFSRS